ncbi:hypothetical protein SEA_ZOOMAN_51 [Microbacterium phage Zooman]|nr:hypothetical protein SEA_ZOOMAN_51 [Microbacterium phage Zooman]
MAHSIDPEVSVQDALDTLHRYSFGARDEIASTDISFLVERVRDEYLRLQESERQHAMGLEEAWRRGRDSTVSYALDNVDDRGFIDQHVLAIGAYRRENPYDRPRKR